MDWSVVDPSMAISLSGGNPVDLPCLAFLWTILNHIAVLSKYQVLLSTLGPLVLSVALFTSDELHAWVSCLALSTFLTDYPSSSSLH